MFLVFKNDSILQKMRDNSWYLIPIQKITVMPLFCGDIVNIAITLVIVKYVSYYIVIKNSNYITISTVILFVVILMIIYDLLPYSNLKKININQH